MKHLFSTWAILLFALFIVVPNSFATKRKAQHVVLIGLDGWGAYSVEKADIPNIKNVMANGAYTLKKRSALPSSSAINWASMFTRLYRMGIQNAGTSVTRIEPTRYFPNHLPTTT